MANFVVFVLRNHYWLDLCLEWGSNVTQLVQLIIITYDKKIESNCCYWRLVNDFNFRFIADHAPMWYVKTHMSKLMVILNTELLLSFANYVLHVHTQLGFVNGISLRM